MGVRFEELNLVLRLNFIGICFRMFYFVGDVMVSMSREFVSLQLQSSCIEGVRVREKREKIRVA